MATVQRLPWKEWFDLWCLRWRQGQHATMIGPTGVGKTTLAMELIEPRSYVVAFGTKPKDPTMDELVKRGWTKFQKWPPPQNKQKVVLWPKVKDPRQMANVQRKVFDDALAEIYKQGSWCTWIDELYYMSNMLGMKRQLQMIYTHARSLDISLLGATQRPAWVPLEAYSQAGHLIIWRTGYEDDLRKIGSMNGVSAKTIITVSQQLDYREFLHVDLVRQTLMVSQLERKGL